MIGLPIAIALGALTGRSEYGLEVLKDVDADCVEEGKAYISEGRISIGLFDNPPSNLHIHVEAVAADGNTATVVISESHTNFVLEKLNDRIVFQKEKNTSEAASEEEKDRELDMKSVYDFAMTAPVDEIRFILEAKKLNKNAALLALDGEYGHSLGLIIRSKGRAFSGILRLNI